MAALANAKHEAFARAIVKGSPARDAYRNAGYVSTNDNATDASASRLLSDAKVQARIVELQQRAADRTETTVERLLDEAWKLVVNAQADKQHAAASQTIERIAKIAGLWVDRSEQRTGTLGEALDDFDD